MCCCFPAPLWGAEADYASLTYPCHMKRCKLPDTCPVMPLQTCAGKGKGKQGMRQGMGSQRSGPQMPPTPPVDPENVEFVLFIQNPKVSTKICFPLCQCSGLPCQSHEQEHFSSVCACMQLPQWLPVSIVKGGRPANLLVGSMESEWGKKLFGKALVRSIAQPIWKVSTLVHVYMTTTKSNSTIY